MFFTNIIATNNMYKLLKYIYGKDYLKNKRMYIALSIIIILLIIIVLFMLFLIKPTISEPVDHNQKIIYFGETCDLENNEVSNDYSTGYQLAFSYINKNGGIKGYYIKLILLNDMYEPEHAAKNARLLIDYYNVLGIIGGFGTATTISILENAIGERPIPMVGPFSAALVYREHFNPYLITTNTSFLYEFELISESIIENRYHNISIVYQDDAYGHAFYDSYVTYIIENNLNINILTAGKYTRNSDDLDGTIQTLFQNSSPFDYSSYKSTEVNKIQAIIVFAAEKEISAILGIIKRINPKVAIYYGFFVGNNKSNLKYLNETNNMNVYQTLLSHSEIEKFPEMEKILMPELKEHKKKSVKSIHSPTSSLIQGFYSGLMICKVLRNFNDMKEITRKTFLEMFYKMRTIDVYGLEMGPFINKENNEAIRYAELTHLQPNMEFKTIKVKHA
jgi:ABC-type branched-subunit amino acid transport system substrate-binding protein